VHAVRAVRKMRAAARRCPPPPARTSGMCDMPLPTLENEKYHRVVYAGLTHSFKISYFYSS